jgi:uncharacterized SAM-binding protein YcdF (DUF218 family)
MEHYDAIVVLSHQIYDDGTLTDETKERTDKGIELLKAKVADKIIFSGGFDDINAPYTHAEAMRLYALSKGVNPRKILLEDKSLDTVAQALFTKIKILKTKKLYRIIVITHKYHIKRTQKIFRFLYGSSYDISFIGVGRKLYDKREKKLAEIFYITFEGVKSADDTALTDRLFKSHELYKGKRKEYMK